MVVMYGLTIVTLIFGIATDRMVTYLTDTRTEILLLDKQEETVALLRVAAAWKARPENRAKNQLEISLSQKTHVLTFRDATGLIDLNAGAPELMSALFQDLSGNDRVAAQEAEERFWAWRSEGRVVQRVSDLIRISGLSDDVRARLFEVATVYSGRRGIAVGEAPQGVLEIATGLSGERLEDLVPETLRAEPVGVNFRVERNGQRLGMVQATRGIVLALW